MILWVTLIVPVYRWETRGLEKRELAGGYRARRTKPSCLTDRMLEEKGSERGRKKTKPGWGMFGRERQHEGKSALEEQQEQAREDRERGKERGESKDESEQGINKRRKGSMVPTTSESCGWVTAACLTEYKQTVVLTWQLTTKST